MEKPQLPNNLDSLSIDELFRLIFKNYPLARSENEFEWAKPFFQQAKSRLFHLLRERGLDKFTPEFGIGFGNLADIPWVAIFHNDETDNSKRGIFCVYLFKYDMSGVYLALNQGVGKGAGETRPEDNMSQLMKNVGVLRNALPELPSLGFATDDKMDLGKVSDTTTKYRKVTAAYKYYGATQLPPEKTLMDEAVSLLKPYARFIESRKPAYWRFIVDPSNTVEVNGRPISLWEFCKENSIAAMRYTAEEDPNVFTSRINLISSIKKGDFVVVYINNLTVGGIARVERPFYEVEKDSPEPGSRYFQRIGLQWIQKKFEVDIRPLKPYLETFHISAQTILGFQEADFVKIKQFMEGTFTFPPLPPDAIEDDTAVNLLLSKRQTILYGPPGTGKTYGTKATAVGAIESVDRKARKNETS